MVFVLTENKLYILVVLISKDGVNTQAFMNMYLNICNSKNWKIKDRKEHIATTK